MNRIWDADQDSELTVGQLPVVESNYVQDSRWQQPAGLTGKHICHPEWLSTGEPWPNNLPPTVYTSEGVPTCCNSVVGQVMGQGDPTGPGPVVYAPTALVMGEGRPMGLAVYRARPTLAVRGEGQPAGIAAAQAAPPANVMGEGEPVMPVYWTAYTGACGPDAFTLAKAGAFWDLGWIGPGSSTGKSWSFQTTHLQSAGITLRRRKNGLPTFYTWGTFGVVWNVLFVSPDFDLFPVVQPGAPVCTITLTPAGTLVYTH